jgi:hypothetical protein
MLGAHDAIAPGLPTVTTGDPARSCAGPWPTAAARPDGGDPAHQVVRRLAITSQAALALDFPEGQCRRPTAALRSRMHGSTTTWRRWSAILGIRTSIIPLLERCTRAQAMDGWSVNACSQELRDLLGRLGRLGGVEHDRIHVGQALAKMKDHLNP